MHPPGPKSTKQASNLASAPVSIHQFKIQNKSMKKIAVKDSPGPGKTGLPFIKKSFISLIYLTLFILPFTIQAQDTKAQINSTLRGHITDATTKEDLVGVSVQIKGTTHGVTTDKEGRFDFVTGQKFPYTLIVTYIGYEKLELVVNGSPVEIQLKSDLKELDQVVITGYSTLSKKAYSGSVAQVKASQLENRSAQSFDQLLGGQAAGVDIVQPSGVLNNTPVFRVRGINSISSGIYPLILVDGVPLFTGLVGGTVANNPLSSINTNDIESINILKDASATAIYGSRAANGVVVVTTKKGKKGKTRVSYDAWASVSSARNLPPLLNAFDYTTIKNEAMVNAGKDPGYKLQTRSDGSIVNTNWYDVAFHKAYSQSHNLSIAGATDATNYFVSLGYQDQNGIVRTNTFKNSLVRLNLDHKLLNNVTIGVNFSYNNSLNGGPNTGSLPGQYLDGGALGRSTNVLPPNVAVYNEDGSYNFQDKSRMGYGANNADASSNGYIGTINTENLQLILDKDKYTSETNNAIGNLYAQWTITKGLDFKTTYGVNRLSVENQRFQNPINGAAAPSGGSAGNAYIKNYRTNWVNTLQYSTAIAERHHFNILAGAEDIYTSSASWGATRTGLTDNFFTSYQGSFTTITPANNSQGENGFRSLFSNFNYDFDRKYLLSYSFRRDGYSGLAEGHKYGNFSGGSVGWNISEESFYKNLDLAKTVNTIQIRASYGQVGNLNIGDYPALGFYSGTTYAGTAALRFAQAGNPNLQWETSKKTDVGLKIGLFNNRIVLDADYYNNVVDGLILDAKQAPSKGVPGNSIKANVGSLYNKGIELGLTAQVINNDKFQWETSINFSTLQNKVTALSDGIDIYTPSTFGIQNMTRVGYSVGSIYAVPSVGVNPANGYRIFVNAKGQQVQYNQAGASKWTFLDGTPAPAIDNYLDGKIQGSSLPTYYGGFNNTFRAYGFDLNLGFTFSGGNKLYNGTRANLLDQRYFNNGTFVKDRWTTPGQITDVPKLIYADNVSTGFSITNTSVVEDGSYVKLKNAALGYRIPLEKVSNGKLTALRLYVQASNIFTITNYRGSDPEISINGNSIASGKDHNSVPNATTITFGANLNF